MQLKEIEQVEETVLSMVVQSLCDYWDQAVEIFLDETDEVQDIAEDITREAIAAMGVSGIQERLYGKVDVKKAIYAFIPKPVPVALMLDAKAEKEGSDGTATLQTSQTSMRIRLYRKGKPLNEKGKLDNTISRGGRDYHVVTVIAKFIYQESGKGDRELLEIKVACVPNGQLQAKYNPTAGNTIWRVGRDSPKRSEDFRVRLSYAELQKKAPWRVQSIIDGVLQSP